MTCISFLLRCIVLQGIVMALLVPKSSFSQEFGAGEVRRPGNSFNEYVQRKPPPKLSKVQQRNLKNPYYVSFSIGLSDDEKMDAPNIFGVLVGKERRFDEQFFGWQYEFGARYLNYKLVERNATFGAIEYVGLDFALGPSFRFYIFGDELVPYINVLFGISTSLASESAKGEARFFHDNGWWSSPLKDPYYLFQEVEFGIKSGYHDIYLNTYSGFTLAYRIGTLYHNRIMGGFYFTF